MAGGERQRSNEEEGAGVVSSSREAFDELALRWRADLTAFARSVLRDGVLAEDAVQDCLLNAYKSLGSYEERGSFRAFLFKILRNCCLKLREKEARARRPGPARSAESPPRHDPEELARAFDGLPEPLREAVRLRVIEEMDYARAASLLGEEPDTVRKRVYKALDILRRKIRD